MASDSDYLSAEQLAEIDACANAATPGPWIYKAGVALKRYVHSADPGEDFGISLQSMHWQDGREVPAEANARFIASARSDVPALLRHLRALTAPADGEALGRELWAAVPVVTPVRWEDIEPWLRDRYRSHALKCHAIGHAAGALSREGEIAALRSELARWHEAFEGATPEEAAGAIRDKGEEYRAEIARLTSDNANRRAAWRVNEQQRVQQHHTIERLAAERDALRLHYDAAGPEHNLLALLDLYHARMTEARTESERLSGQLADADRQLATTIDTAAVDRERALDAEAKLATARADGAREEREACAPAIDALRDLIETYEEDNPNRPCIVNARRALADVDRRARGGR